MEIAASLLISKFKMDLGCCEITNPFFMSNPNMRGPKYDVIANTIEAKKLQNIKDELYKLSPSSEQFNIFIIDAKKTISFIAKKNIIEFCEKNPSYDWILEPIDLQEFIKSVADIAKSKYINDQQLNIIRAIISNFEITKGGFIFPISKEITANNTDTYQFEDGTDTVHSEIRQILDLPFNAYRDLIINYDKKVIDDVVMKKEFITSVNEKLPFKYVPLLLREKMIGKDGEPIQASYWQMYFRYHLLDNRFNYVCTSRQSGKTFESTYLAARLLLLPGFNDIIYICKNEGVFHQPMEYFKKLTKVAQDYKIFTIKESESEIVCNITGSKMKFISGSSKMGARSYNAKHFIIDEGGYIPDGVILDLLPIVTNNEANMYVFSTIDWEMKKNRTERFYQEIIEAEMGLDPDSWSMRVNIDQVEHIPEQEKERIKRKFKNLPDRYYAELYAVMPNAEEGITADGFFIMKPTDYTTNNKNILISRDPGSKHDNCGITVLDQDTGIYIEEHKLINKTYMDQYEFVKKLKMLYGGKVAFDETGTGTAVGELANDIIDFYIHYTQSNSFDKKLVMGKWIYYVGKVYLVDNFQVMIEEGKLKSFGHLTHLQSEISNFGAKTTSTGRIKYEAIVGHDDIINSAFIGAFTYKETFLKQQELYRRLYKKSSYDGLDSDDYNDYENKSMQLHKERFKKCIY